MVDSILTNTKEALGIASDDTSFDSDIIMHINAAFSKLNQLGVGNVNGVAITSTSTTWASLALPLNQLGMVKQYIFFATRAGFDPPAAAFHLDALNKTIQELEWRLNMFREEALNGN